MSEKRLFERFDINVPVRLEISTAAEEQGKIDLESNNLSAGGLFIKTGRVIPPGSPVKIEITLQFQELKTVEEPDGSLVIAVSGYVQRSGPEGTAICFHDDYEVAATLDFLEKCNEGVKIS